MSQVHGIVFGFIAALSVATFLLTPEPEPPCQICEAYQQASDGIETRQEIDAMGDDVWFVEPGN